MNQKHLFIIVLLIVCIILSGCNSPVEQAATMTAIESTSNSFPITTSLPTSTSLPTVITHLAYGGGVNLAGADFGDHALPGTYGSDYIYPTADEVDYFLAKGMRVFRLPFRWERLQHTTFAELDADEQARIDAFVNYATGKGATVLLDPHNYARYYTYIIGESDIPVTAYRIFGPGWPPVISATTG